VQEGRQREKPVVWLHGEVKTPPFSLNARLEAGFLLGSLQRGYLLTPPHSRPMPAIGPRVHELRIPDGTKNWRIIYRIDLDAIVVVDVFHKTTQTTPKGVKQMCAKRLSDYDQKARERQ
jgi:phage-related protein